jgi:membrane protein involved in colicin uptake
VHRWIIGLTLGVLLVGVLGAGCGGGDSETTAITKAQFVKKAEAVCKETQEDVEDRFLSFMKRVEARNEKGGSKANLDTRVKDVYLPAVKNEHEKLVALGAPEADAKEIEEFLGGLADGQEAMETGGGAKGFKAAGPGLTKFNEGIAKYGVKCL